MPTATLPSIIRAIRWRGSTARTICSKSAWAASCSRFYTHLRGLVGVPWLCGLISLAWIAAALCLIADLFQVRRKSTLVLMGALLATAPMLAFCNAGYFNFTDIFMCAFFLSVLAVWLMRRFRWGFLAGAVCLVGSLGLYQSFMASACGLVTMLFILDALDGRTGPRGLAATALKGGGMALLGGVLYKLGMEAALRLTGVEASTAYNTVAYVGNYDQYSILSSLRTRTAMWRNTSLTGCRCIPGCMRLAPSCCWR